MEEAKLVVTEEAVESIVVDLLETADDEDSDAHTEPMRIQLLKMGTLLIRSSPTSSSGTARSSSSSGGTT